MKIRMHKMTPCIWNCPPKISAWLQMNNHQLYSSCIIKYGILHDAGIYIQNCILESKLSHNTWRGTLRKCIHRNMISWWKTRVFWSTFLIFPTNKSTWAIDPLKKKTKKHTDKILKKYILAYLLFIKTTKDVPMSSHIQRHDNPNTLNHSVVERETHIEAMRP